MNITLDTFKHILKSRFIILTSIFAVTFYLRLCFWTQPLDWDEGAHAYIGWAILKGLFPYTDIYNTKPPGIYLIHTILFALVEPSAVSIRIFATIWVLFTLWFVYLLGKEIKGENAGYLAAFLFGIFSSGPMIAGGGNNSEVFMNLPLVAGAYYFLLAEKDRDKRFYLLTGILLGIAFSIKQVAAVNLMLIGAFWLYQLIGQYEDIKKLFGKIVYLSIGFIISWIPIFIYLHYGNAVPKFIYWVFTHSFSYVGYAYVKIPSFTMFMETFPRVIQENGFLWIFSFLACIWFLWKDMQGKNIFFVLWLLFSAIGVGLGGRFFPHYFVQIIPPLAVLASYGIIIATENTRFIGWLRFSMLTISVVLFILFMKTDWKYYSLYNGDEISYHQNGNNMFSVTRDIGRYIGERTEASDYVYILGPSPDIYFTALRLSASRWIFPHEKRFYIGGSKPSTEILEDLKMHKPKYMVVILTPLEEFPEIGSMIRNDYILEIAGGGYMIFRYNI